MYAVAFGLAGYGPELDSEYEGAEDIIDAADEASEQLSRAADSAMDVARSLAEQGDFEGAWREFERSEALAVLSANLSSDRMGAPLYSGRPELWRETVERIVGESFPVDVSEHERLYLWELSD